MEMLFIEVLQIVKSDVSKGIGRRERVQCWGMNRRYVHHTMGDHVSTIKELIWIARI